MNIIKLLGRDINVIMIPDADLSRMNDMEECLGMYKDDIIYLASSLTGVNKKRILKHEIVHAILSITGLTNLIEDNLEEAIADAMENFPNADL